MTMPRRSDATRRHLDPATILDLLEERLAPAATRAAEEHLATPCESCRERVHEAALLIEHMRQDRTPDVPAALHARALDVFVARPVRERGPSLAERIAQLLFDSRITPLAAPARRALGEAHRLRFALGEGALELEIESEERGLLVVRGRLELEEPALHRVELSSGALALAEWPDASGQFVFERVPGGTLTLVVTGPSGRYRVPPLEL
jgi:hypothetical protein